MPMTRYNDLASKVVVVTGANGGMGLAVTEALARSDAVVIASDLQDRIDEKLTIDERVHYHRADVTREPDVEQLMELARSEHGQLDCVVHTAAIEFELARLADCETEDFDRMMLVNLRGTFLCMKHAIRVMLAGDNAGSIVNMASTTSFKTEPMQPAYGASKHAVLGLIRQASLDYANDGIRVNGIAPGNIGTPMLRSALERRDLNWDRVAKSMPLGRFGRPEEIAEAVLWLCSDASSFTTGHVLAVEGGMLQR